MGNQLLLGVQCDSHQTSSYPTIFKRNRNKHPQDDTFIAKYLNHGPTQTIESLDVKRLVFVSLRGLYESWRHVPSSLLYISIFILPLKQKWLYQPTELAHALQQVLCMDRLDTDCFNSFIALLHWKNNQGLIVWILDESEVNEDSLHIHRNGSNPFVATVWHTLSALLMSLSDHIEDRHYDPLPFDETFWMQKEGFPSKYKTTSKTVLAELYFVTMNASAMQEIVYQSNPNTLLPVIEYDHSSACNQWQSVPVPLADETQSDEYHIL
eukprot:491326_1